MHKILYDLAHELQYSCLVAHSAEDAALASQFVPHAILPLDMGLPDQSGLSVLQKFKEKARKRGTFRCVISGRDRERGSPANGRHRLRHQTHNARPAEGRFKKLEDKLTQKVKRVLLVEDDDLQRESVTHLIADEDVEITAVATGTEALARLANLRFLTA